MQNDPISVIIVAFLRFSNASKLQFDFEKMDNSWTLTLYCDDKAEDDYSMRLVDVKGKNAKKMKLSAVGGTLYLDKTEFQTLTFDLINPLGEVQWSYVIGHNDLSNLDKALGKRSVRSGSGPRLEAEVAFSSTGTYKIKNILIKFSKEDSKKTLSF